MKRETRTLLLPALVLLTLAVLLLWCATAGAQTATATVREQAERPESALFRGLGLAYTGVIGVDTAQTMWALGTGDYGEANPVLRWADDAPGLFGALKMLLAVFINWGTAQAYQSNPKAAIALRVALVALNTAVIARNARVLHDGRRR